MDITLRKDSWLPQEDQKLLGGVLLHTERGATITDALRTIAKSLRRTYEACKFRWYSKSFQEQYSKQLDEILSVQSVKKKTVDYQGDWSAREEERFMSIVIDNLANGINKTKSIENAAIQLNRSVESCKNKWYTHIAKKNKLSIEIEVNRLKALRSKQNTSDQDVAGTKLEEQKEPNEQEQLRQLGIHVDEEGCLTENDQNSSDDYHDSLIVDTVIEFVNVGKHLLDAFRHLSSELNVDLLSIQSVWKSKLQYQYSKKLKELNSKQQEKAVSNVEQRTQQPSQQLELQVPEEVKPNDSKSEKVSIEKVEQQVTQSNEIDIDEILLKINQLIESNEKLQLENKSLINENTDLKSKLNVYKEYHSKVAQLLNV